VKKLTNIFDFTHPHIAVEFGKLYARIAFVERGATLNNTNNYADPPLTLPV
jgi:hypothetical protein